MTEEVTQTQDPVRPLVINYCGERYQVFPGETFDIGREGDLSVDDNPYLHRRFLRAIQHEGLWWLANLGNRLSATLAESGGAAQSWLAPGARLPLVFPHMTVVFTAGQTTYEVDFEAPNADFAVTPVTEAVGETTVGGVTLTASQRMMILALAEPMLSRIGSGTVDIPKTADAAARIGWTETRFNRKIDNVCEKLDRSGVKGLRGGRGGNAMQRRARLVEYAIAARLVTKEHLPLLDREYALNNPEIPGA
ncbi:hypothetical protein BSR29_01635 [Boudabousia liubingyangii]|uniref:FHA domain-containing protein n=1 Tax=Boudabousia liubingyangii TaxID=1921764 RepID=A0A1Q5PQ03_9ACTO|nr:hypothetical protein [Boudabousia liubingyangii]OKL49681.1 hypothetical protein BSR29_01635 [Boudabousia liubingyangii]